MKPKRLLGAIALLSLPAILFALAQSAPQLINYQGRLTNPAGQPLDGVTVDMTFTFSSAESGGTVFLSVLQEDVLVSAGVYNVLLGSGPVTPGAETTLADVFKKHSDVWLAVKVDADPEMTPRQRIASVPFALQAGQVDYAALSAAIFNDPDHDGDGRYSILAGGTDCDDGDAAVNQSAPEIYCDGIDQNCDRKDTLLTETRITMDSASSYIGHPVCWTGSEFGISWKDGRGGVEGVYFSRISPEGVKIGGDLVVSTDPSYIAGGFLAWTGSEFGVPWGDGSNIYFARLGVDGSKIGGDILLVSGPSGRYSGKVDWTGSEFGLGFRDDRDGNSEIYFTRISPSGAKIGSEVRITQDSSQSWGFFMAWSGSEFGGAWTDYRDGNFECYFTRISSSGVKIGGDERLTASPGMSSVVETVWTGSEYGVAFQDNREGTNQVYFARVSVAGSKIGNEVRITSDPALSTASSIAWTGSEYGIAWKDMRDGNGEVYFARISAPGVKIGDDVRVTTDVGTSEAGFLSWTGSEYGVTWADNRDGNSEVYFARFGGCR